MLKSSLCDYRDAYILVKGTITVNNTAVSDADANNTNKKIIFKNCAPFTNSIGAINNTQPGNAKDIYVIMPLYNRLEYTPAYEKTSGLFCQYCKDIPAVDDNNIIVNVTDNDLADSFNFKVKMTGQTGDDGTKNVEIMVPLAYLSVAWRSFELPLINCEVNLILIWSANCVIVSTNVANQNATFAILDTKLYVPVVTLSTQDNAKLFQQLKSGFKRVINWSKYLSKPSFQGVNRVFVLTFENDTQRTSAKGYYLPYVEIKDYNVMMNGENCFDQPIKKNKVIYENIRKIAIGIGDGYTTGCSLPYPYFKDTYKTTAIDLTKQQALDADPRAINKLTLLQI